MVEQNKIPSFDLARNYLRVKEEIGVAVNRVLESQHFILGPEVDCIEKEISAYLEVKNAVGCASGTDALMLALMSLDIKQATSDYHAVYFFCDSQLYSKDGAKTRGPIVGWEPDY